MNYQDGTWQVWYHLYTMVNRIKDGALVWNGAKNNLESIAGDFKVKACLSLKLNEIELCFY